MERDFGTSLWGDFGSGYEFRTKEACCDVYVNCEQCSKDASAWYFKVGGDEFGTKEECCKNGYWGTHEYMNDPEMMNRNGDYYLQAKPVPVE